MSVAEERERESTNERERERERDRERKRAREMGVEYVSEDRHREAVDPTEESKVGECG